MAHMDSVTRAQEATITITMTVSEAEKVNHILLNAPGNGRYETNGVQNAIARGIREASRW